MPIEKDKVDKFNGFVKKAFEEVTSELVETGYKATESVQSQATSKIVIIIGICGKSKGRIILESDLETAGKFAVAMNFGDALDDPKDLYLYIAEFANMFCGRATTYANNEYKDREFWLTPPAIFSAEDLEITSPSIQSETVCYSGNEGIFLIDIGFEG